MINNSLKNLILESQSEKDKDFLYIDNGVISKINDIKFNLDENCIIINFSTTYGKVFDFLIHIESFTNWFENNLHHKKSANIFLTFLLDYFIDAKDTSEDLNEIIDDTNEIMINDDLPKNASNTMIGVNQTMDAEKIFKKSMPKSIRNYSGNLGLGTVVW